MLFLSTGEKTLAQHMADVNKKLKAGMKVRMLALPADKSKGLGMFDELNGFEDAAALSDALKVRVAKYYGTPLTAFLHALCAPEEMLRWSVIVRRTVEQFITQNLPASASGQAQRAALRFGLAAAAGESAAAKIDEHGPRTIDRLGFRKMMEHGLGDALHTTNIYYVLPEAWKAEIFKGMNISAVNKELIREVSLS